MTDTDRSQDSHHQDQTSQDDLPPTIPYDYTSPSEVDLTTTATTTTTTTGENAAPPTENHETSPNLSGTHSSSNNNSLSFLSSDFSFQNFSIGSISQTSQDHAQLEMEARRRLFRSKSEDLDAGPVKGRKYDRHRLETAVQNKNLERGFSDLTGTTSTLPLQGYSDVVPLRGSIDQKQRGYLERQWSISDKEKDISAESLGSSSILSDAETILLLDAQQRSYQQPITDTSLYSYTGGLSDNTNSSNNDSSQSQHRTSQGSSARQHSSSSLSSLSQPLPAIPEDTVNSQTNVESTFPTQDVKQEAQYENNPSSTDQRHQLVQQSSSLSSLSQTVPSSFPDQDFDTFQEAVLHHDHHDDNIDKTPAKEQSSNEQEMRKEQNQLPALNQTHHQLDDTSSNELSPENQPISSLNNQTDIHQSRSSTPIPTIRRLRSSNRLSVSNSIASTPLIMLASSIGDRKSRYHRAINAMGATVVYNWELCTHLVIDSIKRTPNILCALASGKSIVSEKWLIASIAASQFIDEEEYILLRQKTPNFFSNKKLYFTSSTGIKRTDAQDLAKAAGAKLRADEPDLQKVDPNMIIITSGTIKEAQDYDHAGYKTMSRDQFLELYGRDVDNWMK
ncbi:uncharacterized protein BX664DRAFT_116375 [Halteromyces radiatus]|uniref:uncharacterized protein n=1 Tax=Halteromyces radiatus TaxID=101107 RepID=UPI00221E7B26|nr:uncharacterized protein BX664DRAFT_116375 [Halteromyces radiatus]KAI8093893.1 hypothetical protein BX664DRAFT_116375 [Halteromyces radiatus]